MKKYNYDVIVIGGGVAGRTAALMLAQAGKKTAIVEAGTWGGSNASYNIPQAAAREVARVYNAAIEGQKFGISSSNLKYNYPAVLSFIDTARVRGGVGECKDLEDAGVDCISGFAQFVGSNEIAAGAAGNITAAKFIIATGTVPANPGITGVEIVGSHATLIDGNGKPLGLTEKVDENGAPVIDKEYDLQCLLPSEVFSISRLPKVALIVGAGATGCEVAEYLAEMGCKVLISEISERVLPKEDPEVGEVIEKRLEALDVKVLTGSRVLALQDGGVQTLPTGRKIRAVKATFMRGGTEKSVRVESVILATGSVPMVDMGLKNTGIKYSAHGVLVNAAMQSSSRNIFAIGDAAEVKPDRRAGVESPNVSSTERSVYEAAVAVMTILGKGRPAVDYRGFVRYTNTYPAVACMGLTEDECMVRDKKCSQILVPLEGLSVANTSDAPDGFVKLLVNKDHSKILGATIVAPEAASMMQELVIALRHDISLLDIATAPHVSSSWIEAVKVAAKKLAR